MYVCLVNEHRDELPNQIERRLGSDHWPVQLLAQFRQMSFFWFFFGKSDAEDKFESYFVAFRLSLRQHCLI